MLALPGRAALQLQGQGAGAVSHDVVVAGGGHAGIAAAIGAAKAGARKVYAVEATDMAKHARRLVEANGVRPTPLLCVAIVCRSSIRMIPPCLVSDVIRTYCVAYLRMSSDDGSHHTAQLSVPSLWDGAWNCAHHVVCTIGITQALSLKSNHYSIIEGSSS